MFSLSRWIACEFLPVLPTSVWWGAPRLPLFGEQTCHYSLQLLGSFQLRSKAKQIFVKYSPALQKQGGFLVHETHLGRNQQCHIFSMSALLWVRLWGSCCIGLQQWQQKTLSPSAQRGLILKGIASADSWSASSWGCVWMIANRGQS